MTGCKYRSECRSCAIESPKSKGSMLCFRPYKEKKGLAMRDYTSGAASYQVESHNQIQGIIQWMNNMSTVRPSVIQNLDYPKLKMTVLLEYLSTRVHSIRVF